MAKAIHDLIVAMQHQFGFTAVMVSHEIPEISVSDYVAMLKNGALPRWRPERICEDDGRRDSRVYFCRRHCHGERVANGIPFLNRLPREPHIAAVGLKPGKGLIETIWERAKLEFDGRRLRARGDCLPGVFVDRWGSWK